MREQRPLQLTDAPQAATDTHTVIQDEKEIKTQMSEDKAEVLRLYFRAKRHDKIKEYFYHHRLNPTIIAEYYAALGDHEHVAEYSKLGADLFRVGVAYCDAGFEKEGREYQSRAFALVDRFTDADKQTFHFFYHTPDDDTSISHYKLRINLNEDYFLEHRMTIVAILKDLICNYKKTLVQFKFHLTNEDGKHEVDFWRALKARDFTTAQDCIDQISDPLTSAACDASLWRVQFCTVFREEDLDAQVKKTEMVYESDMRLTGQGQFTLYLDEDFDINQVRQFVYELDLRLQKINAIQGHLVNTDLPITRFIALRQERFNRSLTYLPGDEITPVQLTQLKNELRKSSLYKALSLSEYRDLLTPEQEAKNDFYPPEELLTAIQAEISRFKVQKSIFTVGMGDKAIAIKGALTRALAAVDRVHSVEEFLRFKQGDQASIFEALQISRKKKVKGSAESWGRVAAVAAVATVVVVSSLSLG